MRLVASEKDFDFDTFGVASVVVFFSAPWAGPCSALRETLKPISRSYGNRVQFLEVDVDDCPTVAARFGIKRLPSLLFIARSRAVDLIGGNVQTQVVTDALREHFEVDLE